jgi:hypothetical protein
MCNCDWKSVIDGHMDISLLQRAETLRIIYFFACTMQRPDSSPEHGKKTNWKKLTVSLLVQVRHLTCVCVWLGLFSHQFLVA